jgi:hypothetical protein
VSSEQLEALLRGALLLRTLLADVTCTVAEARRLLRNEPPFEALRVRRLVVCCYSSAFAGGEAATLALAADLTTHATSHASLQELELRGAPLHAAAALEAVVD